MARTSITNNPIPGPYVSSPAAGQLMLNLVPADPANGNCFTATGSDCIALYCRECDFVWNATQAYTVGQYVQMAQAEPTQHYICAIANTGINPTTDTGGNWTVYEGETATLHSTADAFGRTGDIVNYLVYPGTIATYYFEEAGWVQSDGTIYFNCSSARMLVAVCQTP